MSKAGETWGGSQVHEFAKNQQWSELVRAVHQDSSKLLSKNQFHQTPFHLAIRYGAPSDILLELLELNPAVLLAKNDEGNLPLHTGCEFGMSVNCLLAFLKKEPDTEHFFNKENRSPLDVAKNATVFMMGCSWHFYRDDYNRFVAALENPTIREALWEAQRASGFEPVSNVQPVHDVWDQDERAKQAQAQRLQNHMRNMDKPQVYVGIPVDPDIRANLAAMGRLG